MLEFFKFMCSGFWIFCGVIIILNGAAYFLCNTILKLYRIHARKINISKHGWPPSHLNADGDWKPEPKKDNK